MAKKRVTGAPLYVQMLLTRRCNLKCFYCSATRFIEEEMEPELSTEEWVNVLKRLRKIGVFEIAFSGGEIFLREDILEILEAAQDCKFPKLNISTNATLIDDRIASRLVELKIKDVAVSLDGDEETNNRFRGFDAFGRTITGIEHLTAHGIIPEILFTPLKKNYKKLLETVDILYPLGIRKISFNILHPIGRSKKVYKEIMLNCFTDSANFQEQINKVREKYNDFNIEDNYLGYQCYPDMYSNKQPMGNKNKQTLKPCSAGHTSCNITAGGWVIPCSELFDFKGGNIREKDILDIWKNSGNLKKIRDISDLSTDQIPYCRNCDYNIFCDAGCRADAFAIYKDLKAPDPLCPYWKVK